ncbi:MAG: MMPL family transporter, partial [Myxococcota bacterium]
GSLVLCAISTAIGFYAFVPTDYSGVAELGLIAGTGMFISLVCTLTLLPALLSLGRRKAEGPGSVRVSRLMLPRFPELHPKGVIAAAVLLALVALATVPRLRFDASPLSVRDPGVESVQALRDLLADSTTSPWGIEVLAPDLEGAQEMARRLDALPTVSSTRTLLDFVPVDQQRKLEVLTEISFFMGFPPEGSERPAPSEAEVRQTLGRLRERSDLVARTHPDPELAAASLELGLALEAIGREPDRTGARLERLAAALLPPMTSSIRRLERALSPEPVGLEGIPPSLRGRFESRNGQLRVQAFPKADLDDSGALEVFVAEVNQVSSGALGGAVRIVESKRHITKALRQALAGAVVAIAALLWLLWRRLPDMLLVMTPLLLAALFTCAFSVLADVPLNYADVIVLPLLLGIGVDSGIHLVHRWRLGATDLLGTSTARAVLWSALTTVASFGTLGLSSHRGMGSLGQLLTAGVAITLLCNLVLLPALLAARGKRDRSVREAS